MFSLSLQTVKSKVSIFFCLPRVAPTLICTLSKFLFVDPPKKNIRIASFVFPRWGSRSSALSFFFFLLVKVAFGRVWIKHDLKAAKLNGSESANRIKKEKEWWIKSKPTAEARNLLRGENPVMTRNKWMVEIPSWWALYSRILFSALRLFQRVPAKVAWSVGLFCSHRANVGLMKAVLCAVLLSRRLLESWN